MSRHPTDGQIDRACDRLERMIIGARNANHASEFAVIKAAAASSLEAALRLILPDLRHSISAGDGRFTSSQLHAVEDALSEATGSLISELAA